MAAVSASILVKFFLTLLIFVLIPAAYAQEGAPAPAPTSDGVAVDQAIAYVLLFAALVLTYLIHPLDAFPYNLF